MVYVKRMEEIEGPKRKISEGARAQKMPPRAYLQELRTSM